MFAQAYVGRKRWAEPFDSFPYNPTLPSRKTEVKKFPKSKKPLFPEAFPKTKP
jgi:hypothetical protein